MYKKVKKWIKRWKIKFDWREKKEKPHHWKFCRHH
jgi:hypothetical protein